MRYSTTTGKSDNGGLGNLLWELCRHLEPDRVLVMDLGEFGRSDVHLDRFDGLDTRVVHGLGIPADDRAWLLDGCDVLYSAETWYEDTIAHEARDRGVRTVLHVMPELYLASRISDETWVPTTYRHALVSRSTIVPVPVALDRFEYAPRYPAEHFVNLWAPAMLDRNGTDATFAALELIREPVKFTVLGAQRSIEMLTSPVELDCSPRPYPVDYFDVWPDDADVLVLPRRYAGLSMPVQEAAARGMPAIMTACEPQNEWPGVVPVPSRGRPTRHRMAGGLVDVHDPDPVAIARAVERLATDHAFACEMSARARRWAEDLSWDVWAPRYRSLLGL